MNATCRTTIEAPPHPESTAGEIRVVPASIEDGDAIFALVDEASRTSTVLPRSRASIEHSLDAFVVAARDDEIVGCGALHLLEDELGEVRSLVVAPSTRGAGVGGRIVLALLERARLQGVSRVFTLTDRPDFFARLGFRPTDKATLPRKVWTDCIFCPKFNDCGETALDVEFPDS